ncbi:c-type cytochrome [Acuticoccus sp. I52.16.1]|uniref:c-type cytochrome n=1 Tax=Acuticoccus sp. I52.16.1 TaxID=2928472 RepID=UPI001FD5E5D0|nr:c-type cytochrome [Acuticoccus sp. I52.16.1]UOM35263.1 c-type cytochrome [Acuticoccus sp. I52.16.1]
MAAAATATVALTASFDNSVGLWTLADGSVRWLEGHRAAVKAVAFLPPDGAVSAGDDFAVILWDLAAATPTHRLEGHQGSVADVAVSPDGTRIASAGWDGKIGLWRTDGTLERWLTGHDGAVNAVAFVDDATLASASADGSLRLWSVEEGAERGVLARHGFAINVLAVDRAAGWIAYGAVDGGTRVLALADGATLADLTAGRRPILALARSPDGADLAIGDGEGHVMVVETAGWTTVADSLVAARGPVWALSFSDGAHLVAGGIDDSAAIVARAGTQAPVLGTVQRPFLVPPAEMDNGERQFQRKCSVCHTLTGDGERRAGPTLAGIFGRRAGAVAGYRYSDMLAASDIVWTADSLGALFDLGPEHYVPGSNMPMQRITDAGDRHDLIEFLRQHTE